MWSSMLMLGVALAHAAPPPPSARLGFVGDISFAGRRDAPAAVFTAVAPVLAAPDLTVGNVEGLLLEGGAPAYREARLDISAAPKYAAALTDSGIDLLGTANNHSWDAGAAGVHEHLAHLATTTLSTFGSGADHHTAYAAWRYASAVGCLALVPATLKSNRAPAAGAHVALYGPKGRDLAALYALVAAERAAGCAPIVYVHWGREARVAPDAAVVAIGHALVDAGAALVVGHHPHVLQGVERYRGAVIAWSLGNFVFRNRDREKRMTGLFEVVLVRDGDVASVRDVTLVPLTIDGRTYAPRPASDAEREVHLRELARRSGAFGTHVERAADGRLRFRFAAP